MLFGWRVLGDLRARPGPKIGLDTALIGALSWPLVLCFLAVGSTLWALTDAMGRTVPLPLFVVISLAFGGVLAARLALKVYRWVAYPSPHKPTFA